MIENIYRNIFGWARVRAASPAPRGVPAPIKNRRFFIGAPRYASFLK